jgi:hypothetical protein
MTPETLTPITEQNRRDYREKGYFVLERAIPEADLAMIRNVCDELVRRADAEMDEAGVDELNLNRRGSRYFVFLAFKERPELAELIFSDLSEQICRATIGDDAMLFWEQFVVKGTSKSSKSAFSWH